GVTEYTGYGLFFTSIPYRFYPILALLMCLAVCWSGRDFGPMRQAELDAQQGDGGLGNDEIDELSGGRLHLGTLLVFAPFVVLTVCSLGALVISGLGNGAEIDRSSLWQTLSNIFNESDAYRSILWATLLSTVTAFAVHLAVLRESFEEVYDAWLTGCKSMFPISIILVLAWSIGAVCTELRTDQFIASLLGADFNPAFLPFFTFLCAALISFSTGTSFGTMSILIPIVTPLVLPFGADNPAIVSAAVGSILGGAIFGDHCSPISDTTILSSGASGCTVTAHVNTQLPYALSAAGVSALCLLATPFAPVWALNLGGMAILIAVVYVFGSKTDAA
ncbi:MAG: hypothetical protein GC154_20025, partial [bacterium]|nr:hypothetical protein [bacterium]